MKMLGALAVLLPILAFGSLAVAGQGMFIQSIQPTGEDEVVTIINSDDQPLDLTGWRLESSNSLGQEVKETFWFPKGCLLPAGGILRIHSGPYARSWGDSSCDHREIDLPWMEIGIWNDAADVAWLRGSSGELIDLYAYTTPEVPLLPRPPLRPKPWREEYYRWRRPGERAEGGRYCLPRCPIDGGCCVVKVILASIEPLYNRGVGKNWRFHVSAGPRAPSVLSRNLPQVIYEDRFRGELWLELGAGAVEQDLYPDRGWASRTVRLLCPPRCQGEQTIMVEVRVRENEGPYAGCPALWRFTFKVVVEPVVGPPPPPPPSAEFTVSPPGERRVGDAVTLDGSLSQGESLGYEWDLDGDGRADARGERVSYRVAHEGINLITLTVTDRWGRSDSITRGIRALSAKKTEQKLDLGLFWLTLPALAVGYFLALAFRG